jgi:hypothetical protein
VWLLVSLRLYKFQTKFPKNQSAISIVNPLNTELNSICHLLALLGAHTILHVSRIRVNVGTPSHTQKS